MNARLFSTLILLISTYTLQAQPVNSERMLLVAHRGVVNDTLTENSLASLEETIRRGYTHIEVDLRVTKDGHVVCLHDNSLKRTTGLEKNINEITLAELRNLVSADLVPSFEQFSARSAGRIDLMPDVKEVPIELADAFAAGIQATMEKYGLMENALFIGWPEVVDRFIGKAKVNLREPYSAVKQEIARGEIAAQNYFIFNHAADFDRAEVEGFHELGMPVIVSINTFHYTEGDPIERGTKDVELMQSFGVDGLQIDSVYDAPLLPNAEKTDQ